MIKLSLINIYFVCCSILPGISVFIYLFIPVNTVKVFGGNISAQATRDAAQLWVRTTSNGDILVSLLNGLALFKPLDWHFRQTVIRHHYFVQPHFIALVIFYWSAIFLTLLSGLGWGLDWNTILKRKATDLDQIQLTNEPNGP